MTILTRKFALWMMLALLSSLTACHPTTAKWDPAVDLEPDSVLHPTSNIEASHQGYVEGRRLMQLSRYEEAEKRLAEAVDLDTENHKAWWVLAHCRQMQFHKSGDKNQLGKAVQALQKACEKQPDRPNYHNDLGQLYFEAGRFQEAIQALQKARNQIQDWPDPYYHLAQVYVAMNQTDKALNELETSIRLKELFRERAAKEPAFESLQKNQRFQELISQGVGQ